jgi:hypothetical protein
VYTYTSNIHLVVLDTYTSNIHLVVFKFIEVVGRGIRQADQVDKATSSVNWRAQSDYCCIKVWRRVAWMGYAVPDEPPLDAYAFVEITVAESHHFASRKTKGCFL